MRTGGLQHVALVGAMISSLGPATASAEVGAAIHAEGGAAHRVGSSEANQFGWGAGGLVAPELRWRRMVGVELPVGAVALTDSDAPPPPGQEEKGSGYALFAMPGVRAYPLELTGLDAGLWVAGGGGVARTGSDTLPAVNVRLGLDVDAGPAALGPYAGLLQMVAPDDGLDGEDGRVALLGFHAVYGAAKPVRTVPDRDADGVADDRDRCPEVAEDLDGWQDADGCPDDDNDGDGIADALDTCPTRAEDVDGWLDEDGCPEPGRPPIPAPRADGDRDRDGMSDAVDRCPEEQETVNGYADDDGCPDREQVRVVGDRIVLDRRIHFRVDQADILPESWKLLEEIAMLLADHEEYELIHVTGHADDTGTEDYNLRLSQARAESVVMMLVHYGIDPARLTVDARGETQPRAEGTTHEARRENRRVELEILRRAAPARSDLAPLAPTREAFARRVEP